MKEHFVRIYDQHADDYDLLVRREDHEGNLPRVVMERVPLDQADVIELGVGTGRLTRWLVDHARTLRGFDQSPAMLTVARSLLEAKGAKNWSLSVADHRRLPLSGGVADVAIEGWAFGHLVEDSEPPWIEPVRDAMEEMRRVVRPGGTLALLETLGTGAEEPMPPNERLAALYRYLEEEGFKREVIRTDYAFESVEEAETLCRFFFGDALADRVRDRQLTILPECTGLWWRQR